MERMKVWVREDSKVCRSCNANDRKCVSHMCKRMWVTIYRMVVTQSSQSNRCFGAGRLKRILVDPTSNIRSSQRLSHACLSTNYNKVKPQKAQYNSCNFLDHIPSTWITVENLELIHAHNADARQKASAQLLDKPISLFGGCHLWWNSR